VINNTKKIYGQAFVIYALSEYYAAFGEGGALELAARTFELVEWHNFDRANGGYFEASNRDWTIAEEMRLSERDLNERKSMNTHLHLLEAYTNLYRVWPEEPVREALRRLVGYFLERITDPRSGHFLPFFNDEWVPRARTVSYGHEIEGSWLLTEAASVLGEEDLRRQCEKAGLKLVQGILAEGFAEDFGIFAERREDGTRVRDLQWWQQAEAVVGLLNAFQLTGERRYLESAVRAWEFIQRYVLDRRFGEWFYEVRADRTPNPESFKVCEWKGPYHNARCCLEVLRRTAELAQEGEG